MRGERGLVAYDGESHSDSEHNSKSPSKRRGKRRHDEAPGSDVIDIDSLPDVGPGPAASSSSIIIRRPTHVPPRANLRTHTNDKDVQAMDVDAKATSVSDDGTMCSARADLDEEVADSDGSGSLGKIRSMLYPPPIPDVDDWGIPPESQKPCDPQVEAKLMHFHALKNDPNAPKHFNDSLMMNRSFRNPHMYAKLVEFVDVDEKASNFPHDVWDPADMCGEWFADKIAEAQKIRYEQQASGSNHREKRSRIEFSTGRRR